MKKTLVAFSTLLLLTGCSQTPSAPESRTQQSSKREPTQKIVWQEARPGLTYAEVTIDVNTTSDSSPKSSSSENPSSEQTQTQLKDLFMVRIEPHYFLFHTYQNKDYKTAKSIKEIHEEQKAVLTFNGSFFSEDFKPVGYLKNNSQELSSISDAEIMNGIFTIVGGRKAKLYESDESLPNKGRNITFAVQNGPILLDEKKEVRILSDTGKLASRTALGIDQDGNAILIILQQNIFNADNVITLYQFANMLKTAPVLQELGLHSVLNLDGGPSTGMMIDNKYFSELDKVQNIIVVTEF